jgi:hypothetical protein
MQLITKVIKTIIITSGVIIIAPPALITFCPATIKAANATSSVS